ncbi:MAG: hypothetical protein QXM68_03390 [Candidatus Aenigmatarchaeota archaeon]|nr:hypothetical protein [Candidatus Aenigmarchaeota archaeon]
MDKVDEFITKVDKVIKEKKLDLSSDEDLSIGIMNLISIEEHLFFTAMKTGKDKYFALLNEIREIRKRMLKKIIKDYEGEVWCISKHLLAASMRLMEVGTKQLNKGNKKEARELFEDAYNLYSMFWGLNLGLINTKDIDKEKIIKDSKKENYLPVDKSEKNFLSKLRQAFQKAIDCCKE